MIAGTVRQWSRVNILCQRPGRCAAVLLLAACCASGAGAGFGRSQGNRAAREEAVRAIPFQQLSQQGRQLVRYVLEDVSVFRHLPEQTMQADPALYQCLLDHPDMTVDLWRTLGITKMKVARTGAERYSLDDQEGTTGDVHFLHRTADVHLVYTKGRYEGPLFPSAVKGHVLMLLRTSYSQDADGAPTITARLDTFVRLENIGAELLAKTFHPLLGRVIDDNFLEICKFVGAFSRSAENRTSSAAEMVKRLPNAQPADREKLQGIVLSIGERAKEVRTASAPVASRPAVGPAPSRRKR